MSMMVSFVLSFFPRGVLDEILNLIESVSEGFPSYSPRGIRVIVIPIYITNFSRCCSTQSLIMLDYDGHIFFRS